MLKCLHIKNFTIIDETEVEFNDGLTVLTGETGAGKSILIDALQIVLGERAENSLIKANATRCEITAIFDIAHNKAAQQWLKDQLMDEGDECLIRRVMSRDGRSRITINHTSCSLQCVREFSDLLVHIHGQNQHQQLMKNEYQRELLDAYADNTMLCEKITCIYQQWRALQNTLSEMIAQDSSQQKAFLAFQLQELEALALQENELGALEEEHRHLSHADQWMNTSQQALHILAEDEKNSVLHGLYTAESLLKHLPICEKSVLELLQQATIQTQEAAAQIRQNFKSLAPDPQRMQWVEDRLARVHEIARKHRVAPEDLFALHQNLQMQYQQIDQQAERILFLEQEIAAAVAVYTDIAARLTQSREKAAKKLSKAVSVQIQTLGMPGGVIDIQLVPKEKNILHISGNERIAFLVQTNPGEPPQALNKVVSGGELSRIALAIQVVVAQTALLPTLIFDEVDVGIGGSTAEIVGQKLKNLGKRAQVLCVTHLPQVAAQGDQHLHVQKQRLKDQVKTQISLLSSEEKIQEIARMLGGVKITHTTLAHAREMVG